ASAVRRQVMALDKDIPLSSVATMTELQSNSLAPRRFQMMLLAIFACIAFALAVVGIYGVVSYWVLQRTREIGIRVAIGARPADILWLVVGRGMILAFAGIVLGLAATLGLTRLMAGLLYGVGATDLVTFTGVGCVLISTALAACCIPAWRAIRINAVAALRAE